LPFPTPTRRSETGALGGATLSLDPSERLALVGPNGAGKTTLVRAISGRVKLDEGTITLFGQRLDAACNGQARRRLGVVPQEIVLYPMLTTRENLEAWAALHGVTRGEMRVFCGRSTPTPLVT